MQPTVKYENDANETWQRAILTWDYRKRSLRVLRFRGAYGEPWGRALVHNVPGWDLSPDEADAFADALTLAAQIARAWDAGEPLPESLDAPTEEVA